MEIDKPHSDSEEPLLFLVFSWGSHNFQLQISELLTIRSHKQEGLLTSEAKPPRPGGLKWLALGLICSFGAGSFFCFDLPGAAGVEIIQALEIDYFRFGFIYSIYCVPNALLVFYGSQMYNKLGLRWVAVIYTLCVALGQLISSIGIRTEIYEIVLIGRAVFGIGGESLAVMQNYTVARWFRGRDSQFAFSVTLFASRMGSIICFASVPTLIDKFGHDTAEWIGAWVCVSSFVAVLLYVTLDTWAESKGMIHENPITDDIDFEELQLLSKTFWWLAAVAITFYMAVFPFVSFSNIFLREQADVGKVEAGFYTTMVFAIPCLLEPFLRKVVDRYGLRGMLISLAMFLLMPVYYTFAFATIYPGAGMFFIGISHALISVSLFPCLPLLIEVRQLGTALSIQQALIDLGLGVGPVIAGTLMEHVNYQSMMVFFGVTALVGFVFSLFLNFSDQARMVNRPVTDAFTQIEPILSEDFLNRHSTSTEDSDVSANETVQTYNYRRTAYAKPPTSQRSRSAVAFRQDYFSKIGITLGS